MGHTVQDEEAPRAPTAYVRYTRRWLMLALFAAAGILTMMLQMSFAAIQDLTMLYFNVSATEVNLLSLIFMMLYLPATAAATWCLNARGLRWAMVIGMVGTTAGAWLRYWGALEGGTFFWVLFAGQALAAFAQPFLVNGVTLLATEWFGDSERGLATTIGSVFALAGMAIAFGIGPNLVHNNPLLGRELSFYMLIIAGISSGICLLTLVLFRAKPPTPPSSSSALKQQGNDDSIKAVAVALLSNADYVKLLISFGLSYGALLSLATINNQVFLPEGLSESQAGLCGVVMIAAGTVGAFVFGALLDATRAYKKLLVAGMFGLLAGFLALVLLMQFHAISFALALVCMGFIGFFALGLMPVALDLGVEVTFPVNESQSTGLLYLVIMLGSIAITFTATALQEPVAPFCMTNAMWFHVALIILGLILAIAFNGRYKRMEHEQSGDMAREKAPLFKPITP